jgi:glutathione S-transferase
MATGKTTLYAVPGSPPCAAVAAALALKSIDFRRVDLLPLTQPLLGPRLYGGRTVPGLRIGEERLVGSTSIMWRLDELVAEPRLFPLREDPAHAPVVGAEHWGERVLQSATRRLLNLALVRQPTAAESYTEGVRLPVPRAPLRPLAPVITRAMELRNRGRDGNSTAAELPGHLDHIDALIAAGVIGGDRPNAADLQIGSSIALLMTVVDVRAVITGRPAARLAACVAAVPGEIAAGVLADVIAAPADRVA